MSARKPPGFPLPLEQVRAGAAVAARGAARPAGAASAVPKPALPTRTVVNPQRHLQSGTASAVPVGLGLDSDGVRARMVERLRRAGIADDTVLAAMSVVPRHRFVDTALANQAYEDTSLPIGAGQTISKPSVVAHMLALLREGRGAPGEGGLGKVLEIGSGCGYQAAVLSLLARQVISVERLRALHDKARDNLAPLARHNLRLIHGDGMHGHAPSAPYDSIVAAACGDALPPAWLAQLAPGGRLVAPVARAGGQVLVVVDLHDGHFVHREVNAVLFVPLKSGFA